MVDHVVGTIQGRKLKNIKYGNHRAVLNMLRWNGPMPVSEISKRINLSTTAVSRIMGNLVDKGIVRADGKGESTNEGGKRPELYALNTQWRKGIALLADVEGIACFVFDMGYNVLLELSDKGKSKSYENYLDRCAHLVREAIRLQQLDDKDLAGISVAVPAITDSERGIVLYPVCFPDWGTNLNMRDDLRKRLNLSSLILIENNSRLAGYAEMLDPQHTDCELLVALAHSDDAYYQAEGAGGSVIRRGKMERGRNSCVGEFGHVVVDNTDSVRCYCGKRGCFRTAVSSQRVIAKAAEMAAEHTDSTLVPPLKNQALTLVDIFHASNQGDALACGLMDHAAACYAALIEDIVPCLDPEIIVIQGAYARAGDYFMARLKESVMRHIAPFRIDKEIPIAYTQLDHSQVMALGSVLYLFDSLFAQDQIYD